MLYFLENILQYGQNPGVRFVGENEMNYVDKSVQ